MSLRRRRGNLVIWSSSGGPDGRSWAWRPARPRRFRWWLRTSTLLALVGLVRLARSTRARWEPLSLATGAALMVIGFEVPAAAVAFMVGIGVLVVTLLWATATKGRRAGRAADCWQWHS
jgi:hypothetical protein